MGDAATSDVAVKDMLSAVADRTTVRTAFGEPVTHNGVTVIPVARVSGAGGGGGGSGPSGGSGPGGEGAYGSGTGGGIALAAKPVGVFVLKNDMVRWRPTVDVNKVILGGQVVAVVALLVLRALIKARRTSKRRR